MSNRTTNTALVTVAIVNQSYEAYMIKAFLEDEGISVFLQDELFAQLLSGVSGGIKIQVPATDVEKTCKILTESEHALLQV